MASQDWPEIPQGDASALPADDRAQRIAAFEARLRAWAAATGRQRPSQRPIISVETSAFKGGWLMPCIESVTGQTSGSWVYTIRWDGGDQLSREILEAVQRIGHPQLRVFLGENMGIAPSNRFLTANSIGDFIIQLDDDDMFAPQMVERFVAIVKEKPWAGIVRAKRDFIDEVGTTVPQDPWFPFEPRHYQHGMITDIHNHSQPALISRAAYDRTTGWDGFVEYHYAGADCDIFLKVEEVGPIVLVEDLLYHYRLSGSRTSLKITDNAAYDMWRRLADRTIERIGLPLARENEQPPFVYRRLPRPAAAREMIDFVIIPPVPDATSEPADALLEKTMQSLERLHVAQDAIHLCPRHLDQSPSCNETIRATARPLVCLVRAGVELPPPEQMDTLLSALDERDADLVSPKVVDGYRMIVSADPGFDAQQQPELRGHGEPDQGQFDYVGEACWLPGAALLFRREVDRAVGGFDGAPVDGMGSIADFCLKARRRDFKCVYVGTVSAQDFSSPAPPESDASAQRFRARWEDAPHLLEPIASAHQLSYNKLCDRGNTALNERRYEDAIVAFLEAAAFAPERSPAHEGLGRALSGLGHWPDSVAHFERAARLEPSQFWIHYQHGDALRQSQRLDEAVAAYERAIAIAPEVACVHAGLGHAWFGQQRWDKAVVAFERSVALDPEGFWSFHQLGSAFVKLGLLRQAAHAFERAAALDFFEVFWAHHNLGDVYQSMGRWEDAAASYRRAINERHTVASTHVQLGAVLVKLERWTEAAAAYEAAVTFDPTHADAYHSLGAVLSTLNRWDEAVAAYRHSVLRKPDHASSQAGLGNALFKTQRWEEAASAYQLAVALQPESEWYHSLADALLNLRRFDESAEAFRSADALNPPWSQRPLGSRVAAAEQWIRDLIPAAAASPTGAGGALFVFDTDYGELTTAMYMLLGQEELARRATFLVPSRLFVTNRDILPGRTRHYATVDDVVRAVDAARPDIVYLCSGYVYSFHEVFTLEDLGRLVRLLGERGCAVVTTDPFLGLLSDLDTSTTVSVDMPENASPELRRLKDVLDERLHQHFSVSTGILKGLPHLYPAYPDPAGQAAGAAARAISFFNPKLTRGPDGAVYDGADPIWLFVLASRDYEVQVMFHGKDHFVDGLAGKIEQALQSGRHPVFIGPYDCVQALIDHMNAAGRWSVLKGVTLLTFCPFARFSALLLSAEYAFYWNALSHSMFLRLFNELPVFLFDRGHLVRNVKPLYERIVAWYYQGWDPIYLDPAQDLREMPLAEKAEQYRAAAREIGVRMRRSPAPDAMVERLLREGRGVGSR